MKIGILGSGAVGQALAAGFIKYGHEATLGTRDRAKLEKWGTQNPRVKISDFAGAAKFGEVVVLAVKGTAAASVLRLAGGDNLKGKVILDTTNPIADAPPVNGVFRFFTNLDESLMERCQREYKDAHFVKAFNSIGSAHMVNPAFKSKPTMFICGNDEAAKKTVSGIAEQFGWEVADMGAVEAARAIEPLCMLWCIPGLLRNDWTHAFKLLAQ